MAFQFKADESVSKGVRRIVHKEIDKSLEALTEKDRGSEAIHDARKRFKKVRAVLRLVRADLGSKRYRKENRRFRDAGRPLTEVRDAQVLLDALDGLRKHFAAELPARAFQDVRKALVAHRRSVNHRLLEVSDALRQVAATVGTARKEVRDWPLDRKGWPALEEGLKRVYRAGYRAFAAAVSEPTVENLHEWRKQVKYLWHQLQVLQPVWEDVLQELAEQAHDLADRLGEDHDLAVLRDLVCADPDVFGGRSTVRKLVSFLDRRRAELQEEAFPLGQRLYADKPKTFVGRLHAYWKVWRSEATPARR
jgi:CHAD domain-containing protein